MERLWPAHDRHLVPIPPGCHWKVMKILHRREKRVIHLLPPLHRPATLQAWIHHRMENLLKTSPSCSWGAKMCQSSQDSVSRYMQAPEFNQSSTLSTQNCPSALLHTSFQGSCVCSPLRTQISIQIKYPCTSHAATPTAVRQIDTQTAALPKPFDMRVSLWRSLSAKEINFTTKTALFQIADTVPLQLPEPGEQRFHQPAFLKAESSAQTTSSSTKATSPESFGWRRSCKSQGQPSEKLSCFPLKADSSDDHPVSCQHDAPSPPCSPAAVFPTFPFLPPSPLHLTYMDVSVISPSLILISSYSISL